MTDKKQNHRSAHSVDWFEKHFKLITLMPAILFFLILTVAPTIELIRMAGQHISFVDREMVRVPALIDNFQQFLSDRIYRAVLLNTIIFVFSSTVLELLFGVALALLVSEIVRARNVVRTLCLLPILMPPVAIGNMWRLMYDPDFGVIGNFILTQIGIGAYALLGDPATALAAVVAVDVWHWTPFVFIILLAGIESLPQDVLEASRADGASYWQRLRFIVIPLMWPALLVAFIFRSIFAFKVFDQIFLLTSGGPGLKTEVLSLHVYKVYFQQHQLGYGAFLALVTIAIIIAYLGVMMLVQHRLKKATQ